MKEEVKSNQQNSCYSFLLLLSSYWNDSSSFSSRTVLGDHPEDKEESIKESEEMQ